MSQVGIIGIIAMIPFIIKIFQGILSDKIIYFFRLGHRKLYIVLGLGIQALCLIATPLINPGENFLTYAGLALIMMTGMSLYDTCTDLRWTQPH